MFDSLFEDTMRIIKSWQPKQQYSDEPKYRDDLLDVLRRELNDQQSVFSIVPRQRVSISKEDSRHLCDIGINGRIGIELKKDLSKKEQVDRLFGQLDDYKREYKDIVVVLVGKTEKERLEHLKDKLHGLSKGDIFGSDLRIRIVDKGSNSRAVEKPKSPYDMDFRF